MFKRVDEMAPGEIDRDELQKLLIELEHPLALDDYCCVDDLFRRTDKDGSGHIDFPEFCDLVYVELHDDIGLPHTLYNVGRGVLPCLRSCVDGVSRPRDRRAIATPPRRFQQHRSPTASCGAALEVREAAKHFRDETRPLKTLLAVHHKGIRVRKKAFQKAPTDTMCLPLKIERESLKCLRGR